MAVTYVTLAEAAELEGIKRNSMQVRVARDKSAFITKEEKSKDGGKDIVYVAVSSLSKPARNAWKERDKLKALRMSSRTPPGMCRWIRNGTLKNTRNGITRLWSLAM